MSLDRRINRLYGLLTETGHEADERIAWEEELDELLKIRTRLEKKQNRNNERNKMTAPWNKKVLEGWNDRKNLPKKYFWLHSWVIPLYLKGSYRMFFNGEEINGKKYLVPERENGKFSTKYGKTWKEALRGCTNGSNHSVEIGFRDHLDEFIQSMPCVPYSECERMGEDHAGLHARTVSLEWARSRERELKANVIEIERWMSEHSFRRVQHGPGLKGIACGTQFGLVQMKNPYQRLVDFVRTKKEKGRIRGYYTLNMDLETVTVYPLLPLSSDSVG